MYSRPARGKVPDYPRPIPIIEVDDIPICEDTTIYEHWNDNEESELEERAKSRQKRRQEAAEIYLRGGEVRLLTASLKGPFEKWRNPWGKKRQKTEGEPGLEVPETTARLTHPACLQTGDIDAGKGSHRDPIDLGDDGVILVHASGPRVEPLNPFSAKDRVGNIMLPAQEHSSTKRVEDWLKTSDVYTRRPRSPAGSSPTPAARPPTREGTVPRPPSSPVRVKLCNNPKEGLEAHEVARLEVSKDTPASQSGTSSSVPTHESPQRAEAAIIEQKQKSLHTVPPSSNLPAFEYRRPRRVRNSHPLGKQWPGISTSKQVPQMEAITAGLPRGQPDTSPTLPAEPAMPQDTSMSRPALSTMTSKTSTVHNLPSAQVAPALIAVPPISSAQSTNDMLQELLSTTRSEVDRRGASKATEDTTSTGIEAFEGDRSEQKIEYKSCEQVASAANEMAAASTHNETPVRELETQEMIAAIKPFDFSTIKKRTPAFARWQSPATATKVQPARSSKRASFAGEHQLSDDAQKSIKAGMRVKKFTTTLDSEKAAPKVPLFEETATGAGLVLNDDLMNESLPSISAMFGGMKANAPKGILKSSNAISAAPLLSGNTASTSTRQEAQMPSGQPRPKAMEVDLVHEEDSFDLDAAIDDLGSYLGTWDAEEEATKMAAAK